MEKNSQKSLKEPFFSFLKSIFFTFFYIFYYFIYFIAFTIIMGDFYSDYFDPLFNNNHEMSISDGLLFGAVILVLINLLVILVSILILKSIQHMFNYPLKKSICLPLNTFINLFLVYLVTIILFGFHFNSLYSTELSNLFSILTVVCVPAKAGLTLMQTLCFKE